MEREEGEMSDDNSMVVDDNGKEEKTSIKLENQTTILYKADKNGILITELEKVDASKLEERAKRFGINLTGNRVVTQKQIDDLYTNFGIESGNERHFRFDTLHLSGVDGLVTKDIFEYLEDYKPVSLEWIDDRSCNVVCQDHISAALALLVHSREVKDTELIAALCNSSSYHWREGMPHPKKDLVLMRFATNSDKKAKKKHTEHKKKEFTQSIDQALDSVSKNPWGDLCESWGVYDHQEIFTRKLPEVFDDEEEKPRKKLKIRNKNLAKRIGKRNYKSDDSENSSSDSEWTRKSKVPRMRMHADDEEERTSNKKKKDYLVVKTEELETYAPLSIEVVNTSTSYTPKQFTKLSDKFKKNVQPREIQRDNIQSRLGSKVTPMEEGWSSDDSAPRNENVFSRVQKVGISKSSVKSNVWSRLQSEPKKPSSQDDLRQMLKSKKPKGPDDLRDRIKQQKKGTLLRIEIDNNYTDSD